MDKILIYVQHISSKTNISQIDNDDNTLFINFLYNDFACSPITAFNLLANNNYIDAY